MAPRQRNQSPEEASIVLLLAEAVHILREDMNCDGITAVEALHAAAEQAGRSVAAQAAVIVDRSVRSP